jgi:hypothetical protein
MSTETPSLGAHSPPVPERLGRYRLVRRLGGGGMGEVYLARDERLDRDVALKLLPPALGDDAGARARFQREVRALARLTHPNIIQAYDSGTEDGRPFLVMEFVEGRNLSTLVQETGRLAPGLAADCGRQAALALAHAHARGLVHRDVKPSNLLLSADGRVKLLDLGLARFLQDHADPGLTREGEGMGTPDYASPEQFRDARAADPRSDVYALGCTLYHLLSGRVPFPGSSLSEKLNAHEMRDPPPLEELCPEAPVGLVLVVQQMMAKVPAGRYDNAGLVAEALAPFVAGSSASFRDLKTTGVWRSGTLTVPKRPAWSGRRPLYWAGALLLAALLVGAGVVLGALGRPNTPPPATPPVNGVADNQGPPQTPEPPAAADVLTVARTGPARFRTIGEALEAVRPGQTIRVLDAETYREAVVFNRPQSQRGVTLEAAQKAVLELTVNRGELVQLHGVRGVTLRGFRLAARGTGSCALVFRGDCSGARLERLSFESADGGYSGLEVSGPLTAEDESAPALTVCDCTFLRARTGINLAGVSEDYRRAQPIRGVLICRNQFLDCGCGVIIKGATSKAYVVGNRFRGATQAGVQFEHLLAEADDLFVANNTFFECIASLRIWDDAIRTHNVTWRGNLSLAGAARDMFVLRADDPDRSLGPGDGEAYRKAWRFDHNWREGRPPPPPPTSPDFLRPPPGSPPATEGGGLVDPSLPRFAGALPPRGAPVWDWERTWQIRSEARRPADPNE